MGIMRRFSVVIISLLLCGTAFADSLLSGSAITGDGWRGLDLGQPYVITIVGWNPQSTSFEQLVELMVKHDMQKVTREHFNLAEYLEKGIVK